MKQFAKITVLAAIAFSLLVGTANARVVFDQETGKGSVNKRDIMRALHWSPATLEKNKDKVGTLFQVLDTYYTEQHYWYSRIDHANFPVNRESTRDRVVNTHPVSSTSGKLIRFGYSGYGETSQTYVPKVEDFTVDPYTGKILPGVNTVAYVELISSRKTLYIVYDGKLYLLKKL